MKALIIQEKIVAMLSHFQLQRSCVRLRNFYRLPLYCQWLFYRALAEYTSNIPFHDGRLLVSHEQNVPFRKTSGYQ
jgi:hypothetical protein